MKYCKLAKLNPFEGFKDEQSNRRKGKVPLMKNSRNGGINLVAIMWPVTSHISKLRQDPQVLHIEK